jgi:hypothetical protein
MHSQQAAHVVPAPPLKFRTAGFPQYGFKREVDADLHEFTKRESIYTTPKSATANPCGPEGHVSGIGASDVHVQRPFALQPVMLSGGALPTMASSAPLVTTERLMSSAVQHDSHERVPNLFCMSVRTCRPHYPGGPIRCTAVSSPITLVFAISTRARHPQTRAGWFSRGRLTRLTQVRLRYGLHDCSPFTNKDFYDRAFAGGVAPHRRRL